MDISKKRRSSRERSRSRTRGKSPGKNAGSCKHRASAPSSPVDAGDCKRQQLASHEVSADCVQDQEAETMPVINGRPDKDVKWLSKLESRPDNPEKKAIKEKLRARPGTGKNEATTDRHRTKGPMVAIPPSGLPRSSTASSQSSSSVQTTRRPSTLRSPSPRARQRQDSPFTRQVVGRTNSPTSPCLPRRRTGVSPRVSPSNSRSGSPTSYLVRGRTPSPTGGRSPANGDPNLILAENVLRKRVERALHARLYLLQQDGPNSFVIGGDSPDHKYKVTIGTQNCNCGRGPYCLHLLFVMLRVFQVKESDPFLWSRTLKNYEVETLFRRYKTRQMTRLKHKTDMEQSRPRRPSSSDESSPASVDTTSSSPATTSATSSISSEQSNKEEDLCPICLLEMIEGESLVVCQDGCHNRLHHHCVAIWAVECQRQREQMICPLCRTKWREGSPSNDVSHTDTCSTTTVSTNSNSSSTARPDSGDDSNVMSEILTQAQRWSQVFGEDIIQHLCSREWTEREGALHLLRPLLRVKLVGHDRQRITCATVLDAAEKLRVVECMCEILVSMCLDPVYKVYVAALKGLRCLLACVSCVEESNRQHLKENLKTLVKTILLKCGDGNRRTSDLSVSALMELCKGQSGELGTARELLQVEDTAGLEAVQYVLDCILDMSNVSNRPWQHILGRLNVLEKLIETYSANIIPSTCQDSNARSQLIAVVRFILSAVTNSQMKVSKLSKRIFASVIKAIVHVPAIFEEILDIVSRMEPDTARRLERRMFKMRDDYEDALDDEADLEETSCPDGAMVPPPDVQRIPIGDLPLDSDSTEQRNPSSMSRTCRNSARPKIDMSRVSPSKSKSGKKTDNGTAGCLQGAANDDLSDLSISPSTPRDGEPISFKSEVTTPSVSPRRRGPFHDDKDLETTNCKEEIEREEAEAIAVAMETSLVQSPLTVVPGLTPRKNTDVIVHVQSENGEDIPDSTCYVEGEHWVKGALLGTGAFSSCYQSRDIRTGTLTAVKQVSFYRNTTREQEKVTESLMREIKLLVEMDHPNIVRLLGATQHNGHYNLFVEWMAGGSVATLLSSYGAFEESVIINYLRQLLMGVAFLHDKQVVHRDLKGANLLLDSTGQHLRIADFGTAATMASRVTGSSEFKGQLTGTIAFMAPEVLRGETYGRACDIWSIGCCLIEMATGNPPWNASAISNHLQLIFKIASTPGPPPIPECLTPGMRDLTLRCLEPSTENREPAAALLKHAVFTRL